MFQPWRLKVKEAEQALAQGRLEDAGQLLNQGDLREFLPARVLQGRLANAFAERGKSRATRGETSAGWRDLEVATVLGADQKMLNEATSNLSGVVIADAELYLQAGDTAAALTRLDDLLTRRPSQREARVLHQIAQHADQAKRLERCGKFAEAEEHWRQAAAMKPSWPQFSQAAENCVAQAAHCRQLAETLHIALTAEDWTRVLSTSEQILAKSPEHVPAKDARRRAWQAVGAQAVSAPGQSTYNILARRPLVGGRVGSAQPATQALLGGAVTEFSKRSGQRYILWVDEVGGFLVCEGNEIVLGQPGVAPDVDVAILGDVSRRHAILRRSGEGYILDAIRDVRMNGQPVTRPVVLPKSCQLELGEGVKIAFSHPHPFSASATLQISSRHRTQPSVDGIVLMADACVLGPSSQTHIQCRRWPGEVILYRQGQDRWVRVSGGFTVNGVEYSGQAPLSMGSRVACEDMTFSVEALDLKPAT